jgi:hypothetical protein
VEFGGLQRNSLAFGLEEMIDEIRDRETSRMVERVSKWRRGRWLEVALN